MFVARLGAALVRYEARHGWSGVRDPFTFGRIVNGGLRAFRENRMESAWGRRMRSRRAAKAHLRAIAQRGEQQHEYFAAIGRLGWEGLRAARERQTMPPHVREHSDRVLGRAGQRRRPSA